MESLSTFSQNIPVENSSKIGNPKSHVSVPRKRSENGEGNEAFTLNRDGENKLGGFPRIYKNKSLINLSRIRGGYGKIHHGNCQWKISKDSKLQFQWVPFSLYPGW